MKSRLVSAVRFLTHEPLVLLSLAVASIIGPMPAHAQDTFQIDPQHSVARVFLGSGPNRLESGLARVSGQVVFDSTDPADPSVSLNITPDGGPRSEYAQMSFTSERSAMTADGKVLATGALSVTRVERSVIMEPNEAYAGPQYGEPVAHTDTREVTLVLHDSRHQKAHDGMELSGIISVSRETFPQFVEAGRAGEWPTMLVDDEKCQQPSTIGEDYSGETCTGDVIATVTNRVLIAGTAGGEDYSGFKPAVTPDRKQATIVLDLMLTELPSRAAAGSTATQPTK